MSWYFAATGVVLTHPTRGTWRVQNIAAQMSRSGALVRASLVLRVVVLGGLDESKGTWQFKIAPVRGHTVEAGSQVVGAQLQASEMSGRRSGDKAEVRMLAGSEKVLRRWRRAGGNRGRAEADEFLLVAAAARTTCWYCSLARGRRGRSKAAATRSLGTRHRG